MKIILGTRNSALALWQANWVAEKLKAEKIEVEIVSMKTKGDKVLDVSISKIGSKGVFTEELEQKLASGAIDIAVHSAKDMQSQLPSGFKIIAFTEREKSFDVLVSDQEIDLSDTELTLGTSSTRRIATLKREYPHIKLVDMRGNLQTRIQKMRSGICNALVLAYAGVHRMEMDHLIRHEFDQGIFTPAVGQGSIAIECHKNIKEEKRKTISNILNHSITEKLIVAERQYLAKMNGGCSVPIFGLATLENEGIRLKGGIISLDGEQRITKIAQGTDPIAVGNELAEKVIEAGGHFLLNEIKSKLNNH